VALAICVAPALAAQGVSKRTLSLDDLGRLRDVTDPQVSPDGRWVAYTVTTPNVKDNKNDSDVWMASWDGAQTVRLTFSKESEYSPRWSPDGRYIALLSGRGDEHEADQLWLLDRRGGEGEQVTEMKGSVTDYVWSPDGRRIAMIVEDPPPDTMEVQNDTIKLKTKPPVVIDRYQFKQDEVGYLGERRQHLYLLDLASRKVDQLTTGHFDEALPVWSPDGKSIAFVSKRGGDPDRTDNWDLYVIDARAGAAPRQLTTFKGDDNDPQWESRPAWSPDGKYIAYLQGGVQRLIYYAVQKLAVVPAAGGTPRILTASLGRNVLRPQWSVDGSAIYFLLEDDRASHLARVPASGGAVERVLGGRRVVSDLSVGPNDRIAVLESTPSTPPEVFALEHKALRALSRQNETWLSGVRLGTTEEIGVRSRDGTAINGFIVKPPDYQSGRRYPAILRVHGGPVSQFANEFDFSWQLFAAQGYVVIGVNPRGSSGRGEAFSKAIYADWGNKDVQDVLAAVDFAVRRGLADSTRLGIGGWSYGAMLTNYTIARDARFKAATSGAGQSNALAGYGTDQYVREYEAELGTPWTHLDAWLRVSFPFLHADRIVTPTLFMCGELDFNLPCLNSEQMYQALRSLGRETQLVIYPGQYHTISKPSYQRDRLARYVAWYDKFLKTTTTQRAEQ
jgi:dipeptidyl aminopeptidase/acylaminoacyl peptidase